MCANSIGGNVARRRLLGHPAPLDSNFWYRPKHAAPSLLIRVARRLTAIALVSRSVQEAERVALAEPALSPDRT